MKISEKLECDSCLRPYTRTMRSIGLGILAAVLVVGCGSKRTFEGDWTYVDVQGFNVDATFTSSTIVFKHHFPGHTLTSRGVYTSAGPDSLNLMFRNYEVDDHGKVLKPQSVSRYINQPVLAVPYRIEWKSDDEFFATSNVVSGRNADGSVRTGGVPPLIFKRKK